MGCKLGLELGNEVNSENLNNPEFRALQDHLICFCSSAQLSGDRIVYGKNYAWVCGLGHEEIKKIGSKYKDYSPEKDILSPVRFGNKEIPGSAYTCLGFFKESIMERVSKEEIPTGSCDGCHYQKI